MFQFADLQIVHFPNGGRLLSHVYELFAADTDISLS